MREYKKFYDIHYTFIENIYNIENILEKKINIFFSHDDKSWSDLILIEQTKLRKDVGTVGFSYSKPCLF